MAKVKIYLDKGETVEQVEDLLVKAFQQHAAGAEHKNAFHDPAARDVFNKLINEHEKMLESMIKEIMKVIDEG
jgi:hypothetical protein